MNKRSYFGSKPQKDSHCPCCHKPVDHNSSDNCSDKCDPCDCYEYCDCCEVEPITSCLKKLKNVTNCVFECMEIKPNSQREMQVAFCILLTEISAINDRLDCISEILCKLCDPCREEISKEILNK